MDEQTFAKLWAAFLASPYPFLLFIVVVFLTGWTIRGRWDKRQLTINEERMKLLQERLHDALKHAAEDLSEPPTTEGRRRMIGYINDAEGANSEIQKLIDTIRADLKPPLLPWWRRLLAPAEALVRALLRVLHQLFFR